MNVHTNTNKLLKKQVKKSLQISLAEKSQTLCEYSATKE